MLFPAALISLSLVGASSALAIEPRDRYNGPQTLYARADIKSPGSDAIKALIEFTGHLNGRGTQVMIKVSKGLRKGSPLAPFTYHIHTNALDATGNCASAGGRLDPLQYTDSVVCDPKLPQNCQEGDLSGKHGKLPGSGNGTVTYIDDYLRFFPEDHSILGRSVVVQGSDGSRVACGNIISLLDGTAKLGSKNKDWKPTLKPSTVVTHYPATPFPNPAQTGVTPFVNGQGPLLAVLKTMTFPLANTALSIKQALYIETEVKASQKWVNGVLTTVQLPQEKKVNPFKLPF